MSGTVSRLTQNVSNSFRDFLLDSFLGEGPSTNNILYKYRTFSYVVTLAMVNQKEIESGSYRNGNFDFIIFQSTGKPGIAGRSVPGGNETLDKIQNVINQVGGTDYDYDFLLQDLFIENYVTANNDFTTKIRLNILEPYSADVLIGRIIQGLRTKGYTAFSKSTCFILKVEFVGWRDDREFPEKIPYTTRFYPIIITDLKANFTNQGTTYEIQAVPLNDTGRYSDVNVVPDAITVTGDTVENVMKDFEKKLNEVSKNRAEQSNQQPNKYVIIFEDIAAEIGGSRMFDPTEDLGVTAALKQKNGYTAVDSRIRKQANAEGNTLTFSIPASQGISKCIDSIVLDSKYVTDLVRDQFQGQYENGFLKWWRVVIKSVRFLNPDNSRNDQSKEITYAIVPRRVHAAQLAAIFRPANVSTVPQDWEKFCIRRYEWLFTGNNRDILNFSLRWDTLFMRTMSANYGRAPGYDNQEKENAENSGVVIVATNAPTGTFGNNAIMTGTPSGPRLGSESSTRDATVRNTGETNPAHSVARDVHRQLNYPWDGVNFEMEILGDPMWMGTQFIDTFNSGSGDSLTTRDGNVAFRTTDPVIRVLAYSAKDYNNQGFLTSENRELAQWSAYYRVTRVESYFTAGVFKQKLYGYRGPGEQDLTGVTGTNTSGLRPPGQNTYSFGGFGVNF